MENENPIFVQLDHGTESLVYMVTATLDGRPHKSPENLDRGCPRRFRRGLDS